MTLHGKNILSSSHISHHQHCLHPVESSRFHCVFPACWWGVTVVPPPAPPSCQNRKQSITFPVFSHFSLLIQNIMCLFGADWPLCLFWINAGYGQGSTALTSSVKDLAQEFLGSALKVPLNLFFTPSKFCPQPRLEPRTSHSPFPPQTEIPLPSVKPYLIINQFN